jgi:hypothetical protein
MNHLEEQAATGKQKRKTVYAALGQLPLIVGLTLCCFAQTPQPPQNSDSRVLKEVKRKQGWMPQEITKLQKITSVEEILIDGLLVKETRLEIPGGAPGNFDLYWLDKGNLFVHSYTADIQAIASLEYEKKIFAYSASHVIYTKDDLYGKTYAGAIFVFYYYDEDGDGVFETRRPNEPGALFVPKWVRSAK